MILQTVAKTEAYTARTIYTAPGQFIPKPSTGLSGLVVVSVLVFAQLIGLAYLAWYIYQVPTWTDMLDALAVARITNSLSRTDIPSLGSITPSEIERLRKLDGLVGVIEHDAEPHSSYEPTPASNKTVELDLGAPGIFHRRLARFRLKRSSPRMAGDIDLDCMCEGCRRRRPHSHISTPAQHNDSVPAQ